MVRRDLEWGGPSGTPAEPQAAARAGGSGTPVSAAAPRSNEPRDPIDRWLDGMVRAMRLPARDRQEIREEIDAHVRERVRDLMLGGMDEARAVHCAISELGDAALLAQRYAHAAKSGRRFVMQLSLTAVLASAVAIGAWSIAGGGSARVAQEGGISGQTYAEAAPKEAAPAVDVTLKETTLADALAQLAGAAGKTLYVRWAELEPLGLTPESPIDHLPLTGVSLDDALGMLGEHLDAGWEFLDHRMGDRLLTVATRGYFDRRERRLHVFDIGQALTNATPQDIEQLLFEMVSPNDWDANGGEVAKLRIAADKLFVTAPPRILRKVEWVLAQLEQREAEEEQAAASPFGNSVQVPMVVAEFRGLIEMPRSREDVVEHRPAPALQEVLARFEGIPGLTVRSAQTAPGGVEFEGVVQGPDEETIRARLDRAVEKAGGKLRAISLKPSHRIMGRDAERPDWLRKDDVQQAGRAVIVVPGANTVATDLMRTLGERIRRDHAETLADVAIEVDQRTNSLILHGPGEQVRAAQKLAQELDRAQLQSSHRITVGDTLASIAHKRLGDAARAAEILELNAGLIADRLPVGRRLALPAE